MKLDIKLKVELNISLATNSAKIKHISILPILVFPAGLYIYTKANSPP